MPRGIFDIIAEKRRILNSPIGIELKTTRGRGGYMRGIFIFDAELENISLGISMTGYSDFHPDDKYDTSSLPVVGDITFKNMIGENISVARNFSGIVESPFSKICLSNMTFSLNSDASPSWFCSNVIGFSEHDGLNVVVNYLQDDGNVSLIGLWGRSMGVVTSLMYGAKDPSIAGMVLDSPFSDLVDLMMELVDTYKVHLPKFTYMRRAIQKKTKFDIMDLNTIKDLKVELGGLGEMEFFEVGGDHEVTDGVLGELGGFGGEGQRALRMEAADRELADISEDDERWPQSKSYLRLKLKWEQKID
ncbi:hypothetical protein JHK86_016451 [Glycine max]|nr:hypothetical protein JHK86_016451 [Glycine max]